MKIKEHTRLLRDSQDLAELCTLLVALDPWPIDTVDRDSIVRIANCLAFFHGYSDYLRAYHEIERRESGVTIGMGRLRSATT